MASDLWAMRSLRGHLFGHDVWQQGWGIPIQRSAHNPLATFISQAVASDLRYDMDAVEQASGSSSLLEVHQSPTTSNIFDDCVRCLSLSNNLASDDPGQLIVILFFKERLVVDDDSIKSQ